jgi:hypothetical protein
MMLVCARSCTLKKQLKQHNMLLFRLLKKIFLLERGKDMSVMFYPIVSVR